MLTAVQRSQKPDHQTSKPASSIAVTALIKKDSKRLQGPDQTTSTPLLVQDDLSD